MDVNEELKFLCFENSRIFFFFFEGGVGLGGVRGGCQGGCERRIEVFVKIQKKKKLVGGSRDGGDGQVGGGVRVDVNEELKFL